MADELLGGARSQQEGAAPRPVSGSLLDFVAQVSGEGQLRVEERLGDGFVRLRVAEAERRQAKHDIRCVEDVVIEMLRNARDAGARHIYVATTREGDVRTLTLLDDGSGIPKHMHRAIFDARVTSKLETMTMDRWGVHGRGMALYSIAQNVEDARVVASAPGLGSSLAVRVDCAKLAEKTDQSSWPSLGRDEDGVTCVARGPHNIVRTLLEFALEERDRVSVYLGTPTEIAATLFSDDPAHVDVRDLVFCRDVEALPVCSRLRAAGDAGELVRCCADIGLDVSERTAHRILSGQIGALAPALSRLVASANGEAAPVDLLRDRRGLKVTKADLAEFSRDLERAFAALGEKYYVTLRGEPKIRVTRDRVTVTYDLAKED